tara:strand:+ start:32 stop:235 length:204 start_codon:yes stop_codon:yes gene_type:complete
MQYIEKGDVVKIKNMPLSIHNDRVKGKVGIVLGQSHHGKRYKDRQIEVSIPNYRILHILPMHLELIK